MNWFSEFFGTGNGKIRQAMQDRAVIIDLRNPFDFDQGHIPLSMNIPAERIKANITRIRALKKPIILCCGTGEHCREAMTTLTAAGIPRVYNGGNWVSLWKVIRNS